MSEYSNKYTLVQGSLSKDQILEKYGQVSFAYRREENGIYDIVAISEEEPPHLRSFLLIDKVDFLGVDSSYPLEIFCGVI